LFSTRLAPTNPIPGPAGVTGVRTRTPRRPRYLLPPNQLPWQGRGSLPRHAHETARASSGGSLAVILTRAAPRWQTPCSESTTTFV
jgi:hypothetical protein